MEENNSDSRKQLQHYIVVIALMVIVLVVGMFLSMEKFSFSPSKQVVQQPNINIEKIYVYDKYEKTQFKARSSIFYVGVHAIAKSDKQAFDVMTYILANMKPVATTKQTLEWSEKDIVVVFKNGEEFALKIGSIDDKQVLLNWQTKQLFELPALTFEQQETFMSFDYQPVIVPSLYILLLIFLNILIEYMIRKRFGLKQRIDLYKNKKMNQWMVAISILLITVPLFVSLLSGLQIHMIVSLILAILFIWNDWQWHTRYETSKPHLLFKYWTYLYTVLLVFLWYFLD